DAMTATTREQHGADPDAGLFEDLVSIEPITSLSALHKALNNGHPVLAGAALPEASAPASAHTSGDAPQRSCPRSGHVRRGRAGPLGPVRGPHPSPRPPPGTRAAAPRLRRVRSRVPF